MYVGDMVSKIDSEWIQKNPWMLKGEKEITSLFYHLPELIGVIVSIEKSERYDDVVSVLLKDGSIEKFKDYMLEVIK